MHKPLTDTQRSDLLDRALSVLAAQAFPVNGTLLGMVRDGALLPWDHDVDLAVHATDWDDALLDDLRAAGFKVGKPRRWSEPWMLDLLDPGAEGQVSFVKLRRAGGHVDLRVWWPGGESSYFQRWNGTLQRIPTRLLAPLLPIDGHPGLLVPGRADELLEFCYGSSWRTPDPDWYGSSAHREVKRRWLVKPS